MNNLADYLIIGAAVAVARLATHWRRYTKDCDAVFDSCRHEFHGNPEAWRRFCVLSGFGIAIVGWVIFWPFKLTQWVWSDFC